VSNLKFGCDLPPNFYSNNVLSKAKQQHSYNVLGITEKCPIKSVIELKHNSIHSGSIHSIGCDPFLLHYWTIFSETDGWLMNDEAIETPAEKCRNYLLSLMKVISNDTFETIDDDGDESYDIFVENDGILNHDRGIVNYMNCIENEDKTNASVQGNRMSAYYLPELRKYIQRPCYDFPL